MNALLRPFLLVCGCDWYGDGYSNELFKARNRETPAATIAAPESRIGDRGELAALVAAGFTPARDVGQGTLARRFRLAGLVHAAGHGASLAILDDREKVRQFVVAPGESLDDGVSLVSIRLDAVTLAGPDGEEDIALEKSQPADGRKNVSVKRTNPSNDGPDQAAAPPQTDPRAAAAERFGGREVFPGRWAYDRERVIEYYSELRANPERLLSIFDSMDPVWGKTTTVPAASTATRSASRGNRDSSQRRGFKTATLCCRSTPHR